MPSDVQVPQVPRATPVLVSIVTEKHNQKKKYIIPVTVMHKDMLTKILISALATSPFICSQIKDAFFSKRISIPSNWKSS